MGHLQISRHTYLPTVSSLIKQLIRDQLVVIRMHGTYYKRNKHRKRSVESGKKMYVKKKRKWDVQKQGSKVK